MILLVALSPYADIRVVATPFDSEGLKCSHLLHVSVPVCWQVCSWQVFVPADGGLVSNIARCIHVGVTACLCWWLVAVFVCFYLCYFSVPNGIRYFSPCLCYVSVPVNMFLFLFSYFLLV